MRIAVLFVAIAIIASTFDTYAQQPPPAKPPAQQPQQVKPPQRRSVARTATFAIVVTDPAGTPIPNTSVTAEGPTPRTTRTEGGRIALEGLQPGEYLLRFEKDGYLTFERQLTARAGKPIEVKVTLKPAPEPPAPPAPPPASEETKPPSTAKPAAFDVPDVIEKQFIGRAPQKTTSLVCADEANATLIQLNDPIADHTHDADEFLYVVAGEGAANIAGAAQRLRAGVLLFVPRGTKHRFSQSGRNPLIILSMKAGGDCQGTGAAQKR